MTSPSVSEDMIRALDEALEGECDGLSLPDEKLRAILIHVGPHIELVHLPAGSEAVKPTVWIEREVLEALIWDKTASGTVCSGLLKKPFGDPVPLFAAPPSTPPAANVQQRLPTADENTHMVETYAGYRDQFSEGYQLENGPAMRGAFKAGYMSGRSKQAPTVAVLDEDVCPHNCDEGGICLAELSGYPESCSNRARAEPVPDECEQSEVTIPVGWYLVPEVPTEEQMSAGLYQASHDASYADVCQSYMDMVRTPVAAPILRARAEQREAPSAVVGEGWQALREVQAWVQDERLKLIPLDPEFTPKHLTLKAVGKKLREALAAAPTSDGR